MNEYVRTAELIQAIEIILPYLAFCFFVCVFVAVHFVMKIWFFIADRFIFKV